MAVTHQAVVGGLEVRTAEDRHRTSLGERGPDRVGSTRRLRPVCALLQVHPLRELGKSSAAIALHDDAIRVRQQRDEVVVGKPIGERGEHWTDDVPRLVDAIAALDELRVALDRFDARRSTRVDVELTRSRPRPQHGIGVMLRLAIDEATPALLGALVQYESRLTQTF